MLNLVRGSRSEFHGFESHPIQHAIYQSHARLIASTLSRLLNISGQFHQHFTCAIFVHKCFFCQNVQLEKSCANHFHTKNVCIKCWWNWPKVSISPTFYEQLLCVQIPKGPKIHSSFQSFLHFWDLCEWKLLAKCWLNWLQVICVPDTESWHVTKKLSNTREVVTSHNFRMSGWSFKVAFFSKLLF